MEIYSWWKTKRFKTRKQKKKEKEKLKKAYRYWDKLKAKNQLRDRKEQKQADEFLREKLQNL